MKSLKKILLLLAIFAPIVLMAADSIHNPPDKTAEVPINPAFLYLMVAGLFGFVAYRKRHKKSD